MIRKSLFILSVLLLSSTVQIEAMQNGRPQLISQNNNKQQILNEISNILDNTKINQIKKEEILSNISEITNVYALHSLSNVLGKLPDIVKTEEILFNISNMDIYKWDELCKILDILPEEGKTEEILFNISKINNISTLRNIKLVLSNLPEHVKTKNILFNISNISDTYTLQTLHIILYELPEETKTEKILLSIINMNYYSLSNLYDALDNAENNDEKMQILYKYGVLSQQLNK